MLVVWLSVWLGAASPAAAPPPDPVEAGPFALTFGLQRPLTAADEAVWSRRLAEWDQQFSLARYAVPVAPPTAGGNLDAQLALLARTAGLTGPERLVVVTPPVGSEGWETSHNLAWLPLGGRPGLIDTPHDGWLAALAGSAATTLALAAEGLAATPSPEQWADYLDAFLAACRATEKRAELWLPAAWALAAEPSPLLTALTPARLDALAAIVWLGTATAVAPAPPETPPADPSAGQPTPTAGTAPEPNGATANRTGAPGATPDTPPDAAGAEIVVVPVAQQIAEGYQRLAAQLPDTIAAGIDLADSPRHPLSHPELTLENLHSARDAGFGQLLLRGRLDTPQEPAWRTLLTALAPAPPQPSVADEG